MFQWMVEQEERQQGIQSGWPRDETAKVDGRVAGVEDGPGSLAEDQARPRKPSAASTWQAVRSEGLAGSLFAVRRQVSGEPDLL